MKTRLSIIAAVALAVLCGALYLTYYRSSGVTVIEYGLGRGVTDSSHILVSANGLHAAFIATTGTKQRVLTDGVPDETYDAILDNHLVSSTKGQRIAYAARLGSKELLVADHHVWQPSDKVFPYSITFSPDGRHLACVVESQGKQAVVLDGTPLRWYDRIEATEHGSKWLFFSPDGRRLAFVARHNGKQFVVLDGVEGKTYDWIGTLMDWLEPEDFCGSVYFSPDSKHAAYAARKGDRWLVVMDGVEGRAYGTIAAVSVARGGRLGYVAGTRSSVPARTDPYLTDWWVPAAIGSLCIVVDGREVDRYTWPDDWHLSIPEFSLDGKRVSFRTIRGHKQCLVVDGVKGKGFDEVSWACFSPDSRHYAYVGAVDSKETFSVTTIVDGVETVDTYPRTTDYVLVKDGKTEKRYKRIQRVTFSPDSKRLAYMAAVALDTPGRDIASLGERLRWFVVVDGKAGRRYVELYEYTGISFSPNSRHVSYLAFKWIRGIKRQIAVLDEKEYDEGLFVSYGAGGKRTAVACRVWPKHGLYIVLDGEKRLTLLDIKEASLLTKKYGHHLYLDQVLFTRDGKHVAYTYSVGLIGTASVAVEHYIGMDGQVVGEYHHLPSLQRETKSVRRPQEEIQEILPTVIAPVGPSGVSALAVRNGQLLRVEARPGSR